MYIVYDVTYATTNNMLSMGLIPLFTNNKEFNASFLFLSAPFLWTDPRGMARCSADLSGKKKSKKELKAIELQNAQGIEKSYPYKCVVVICTSSRPSTF